MVMVKNAKNSRFPNSQIFSESPTVLPRQNVDVYRFDSYQEDIRIPVYPGDQFWKSKL